MKNTCLVTLSLLLLSSCSFIDVRVRTIPDNNIVIIDADKSVFKGFKVGDTIQISKSAQMDWELQNTTDRTNDFRTFSWYDKDSTKHSSYCEYKIAIIEQFVK